MNDLSFAGRLPEASDAFARAILAGGERVKRYQRRCLRLKRLSMAAAALLVVGVGIGAAVHRLNAPRPDPVVTAVDPESAVVLSPEPEVAAPEQAMLRIPEEDGLGYTYVLDVAFNQDGPFEAGEWAVICGLSGKIDNSDRNVGFYERPDAASSRAETVQGMRAQFLEDAGNGFARVRFEGMEGYIETAHLAHGGAVPEADATKRLQISDARLAITDAHGAVQEQVIYWPDKLECYALLRLLEELEPAEPGQYETAPFGAVLRVTLWDPDHPEYDENGWLRMTERFLSIPRDGTFAVMAEDGAIYSGEDSAAFFWAVFDEARNWTWKEE